MIATLQYALPYEAEEHQTAIDAMRWRMVVGELDEYLRNRLKYESDQLPIDAHDALEAVRARLLEEVEERGLRL
jgi:hypothetical protein